MSTVAAAEYDSDVDVCGLLYSEHRSLKFTASPGILRRHLERIVDGMTGILGIILLHILHGGFGRYRKGV